MALTKKQEMFCIEVIKQPTLSAAYRIAYNTSNMTDKSVNELASTLMRDVKITSRVKELRSNLEQKELYTLEQSILSDLDLIDRYKAALDILGNDKASTIEKETAREITRAISVSGYNSAQERLSKQSGWFIKDNAQKKADIILSPISKEELNSHKDKLESEY